MKVFVYGVCAALALGVAAPVLAADAPAQPEPKPEMVTPEVLAEMGKLVEQGVQVASGPLQTSDEFEPYGVLLKADGKLQLVRWQHPDIPADKMPPAIEILRRVAFTIVDAGRKDPDIIAAVTVAPTSVPTTDGKQRVYGLRAEVDHRKGAPQIVFIPYLRKDGKVETGTPVYQPSNNMLFIREGAPAAQPADAAPAAAPAGADKKPAETGKKKATK